MIQNLYQRAEEQVSFPQMNGVCLKEARILCCKDSGKSVDKKPRRNMHTSSVRRASLPFFVMAFEPTALVRIMIEHRDLKTDEKVAITSAASWHLLGRLEHSGSHTHRVGVKFPMCCLVLYPPAEGQVGQKSWSISNNPHTAHR